MAYEVIKRVSGRAYRYRVESFRDPETRRVRGRWTYLGRVDPAEAGLPERTPRPRSKERLLDAVSRLLATQDAESLSAASIAAEAGVAYGTFYRYFTDRAHAVREALLLHSPALGDVQSLFCAQPSSRAAERERIAAWMREAAEAALRERGLVRAWHVSSNADDAVLRARREATDAAVDALSGYLEALRCAGVASPAQPQVAAYALVALVVALGRDAAFENALPEEKLAGLTELGWELAGLA